MDLSPISFPLEENKVTKIESDKETLIGERLKLFKAYCAIKQVIYYNFLNNMERLLEVPRRQ